MKKNFLLGLAALAGLSLASCGGTNTPSSEPQPSSTPTSSPAEQSSAPAKDYSTLLATFDKEVSGTVKLTYTSKYKVDVDAHGGSANMESFKHDINNVTEVEMNLTTPYFYAKKSSSDKGSEAKVVEYLLAKGTDGKYYYQTTNDNPVEVADAAAKVKELFASVVEEQAGVADVGTLSYASADLKYELAYVGMTDTWTTDDLEAPTYSDGANGGIHVEYKPEYVGYHTDGGWSDFSNKTDGYAATVVIDTNNKGNVTSWTETYNNASLDFAIMTPAPTVLITGTRGFTATYGETITEKTSVERAVKYANINYTTVANGTYTVATFPGSNFGAMKPATSGSQITAGDTLAIKPVAAEGYEVDKVSVNGNEQTMIPVENAGGFYCFVTVEGDNNISVSFKLIGSEGVQTTLAAPAATNGTYAVATFPGSNFGAMAPVTDGAALTTGDTLAIKPAAAEGYEVAHVSVNGSEATMLPVSAAGGYYCFKITEGSNDVVVKFRTAGATNILSTTATTNGTYVVKTCPNGQFNALTTVVNGEELTVGNVIAIKPAAAEGYVVDTVKVNGSATTMVAPSQAGGFYCFAIAAGTTTVEVTFKAAE